MEKAIAYLDTGEMPSLWEADTILLSKDDEDEDHEVTLRKLVHGASRIGRLICA